MDKASGRLTVYFEDPFWIGVFERMEGGMLTVAKVTFGAEPKDYEVYAFLLRNYHRLQFSPAVETPHNERKIGFKRMQHLAAKQLKEVGIGTRSQQALKLLQEQNKLSRETFSRQQREAEAERRFAMKQHKKKEKHRGH